MTDRELAELSQLSYLNLPKSFLEKVNNKEYTTLQEFMEYCIEKPENMGISKGDYTYQLCQKYAQEQYKDLQILNYTNQNETNGYVGYALKDSSGNVVIASRGSESPGGEDTPEVSGVCGTMIDWIDNFRLPSTVQTDQQEAAKNFANKVGRMDGVNGITLTGHSKGGNDATYISITVDEDVRNKIVSCVTFNAPGHSKEFMDRYKIIIDKMVQDGVYKEFQNEGDVVSSILNIFSKPIIIQTSADGTFSFDHHSIKYYVFTEDGLALTESSDKSIFSDFVNSAVNDLTGTLTPEEIAELIDLVEKVMDGEIELGDILSLIYNAPESIDFIGGLLVYAIFEGAATGLKDSDNIFLKSIGFIMDLENEANLKIRTIGIRTRNKIKSILTDGISYIKGKFNNFISDASVTFTAVKSDIKNLFNGSKMPISNSFKWWVNTKEFYIDFNFLNHVIEEYTSKLDELQANRELVNNKITAIIEEGWEGTARDMFFKISFTNYKKDVDEVIKRVSETKEYLQKALERFNDINSESTKLVSSMG